MEDKLFEKPIHIDLIKNLSPSKKLEYLYELLRTDKVKISGDFAEIFCLTLGMALADLHIENKK